MSNALELDSVWRDRIAYPNPCEYEVGGKDSDQWFNSSREVRAFPPSIQSRPLEFVTSVNVQSLTLPYPRVDLYATESNLVTSILANVLTSPAHTFVNGNRVSSDRSLNQIDRNTDYFIVGNVPGVSFQLSLTFGGPPIVIMDSVAPIIFFLVTPAVLSALTDALQLLTFPRIYLDFTNKNMDDIHMINTIGGIHPHAKFILVQDRVQFDNNFTPIWIHFRPLMETTMRFKRNMPLSLRISSRNDDTIPFFTDDLVNPANPFKQTIINFIVTPYIRDNDYANHLVEPIS